MLIIRNLQCWFEKGFKMSLGGAVIGRYRQNNKKCSVNIFKNRLMNDNYSIFQKCKYADEL